MTDIPNREMLAKLPDQTRRRILKSISVGVTGVGFASAGAAAATGEEERASDYGERMYPGRRDVGNNIALTNNTDGEQTVTVRVRRQTSGGDNSIVFEKSYRIPGPDESDEFPNVVRDSEAITLGTPGYFRAAVETDHGRSATTEFHQPTGRIRSHESLSIRLKPNDLHVDFRKA